MEMDNEEHSGPMTSLEGADGKVPDDKYGKNNFLPGPGGILLIIVAILAVVCGIGEALNWHW
jgi:hypothetical protein